MGAKPAVQLCFLGLGKLELAFVLDDTVPNSLDKVDTVSDRQVSDFRWKRRLSHDVDSLREDTVGAATLVLSVAAVWFVKPASCSKRS